MKAASEYGQEAISNLFEELGAFFAFGQKQFDEKKKEGVKYVALDGGMICPKENINLLIEGLNEASKKAIEQDFRENGAKNIIEREYFNYETQISMDRTNVLESLEGYKLYFPNDFTDELINKTFAECFKKAVENDWF
jgi:uncharacterized Fe-S cluster-containing radical SAM superfamily protein